MSVICLNCDGWGCAQCKNERAAAAGGEQGPTSLELDLQLARAELAEARTRYEVSERDRNALAAEVAETTRIKDAYGRALGRVEDALGIEHSLDLREPERTVLALKAERDNLRNQVAEAQRERDEARCEASDAKWQRDDMKAERDAARAGLAPEPRGALSLREMQERLPWTIPYSPAFVASPEPHRNLAHDVMHVMKSLGRIAALAEDFDHGRPPRMTREQLAKELADLPICALHIAKTNPLGPIDLHEAVVTHSELRNAAPGALSVEAVWPEVKHG